MQVLRQDLAYAVRQLRRTPGFTLLVLLTIALGIGANTAVFSLVNGYLRPLPVRAPGDIVVLAAQTKGDDVGLRYRFSFSAMQDFRAHADSFSDVFAYDLGLGGLNTEGKTTEFLYCVVSGNFFPALGLDPAAGRLFASGEGERPGGEAVLVLGHAFWQKRFGGAADAIGRHVRVNGRPVRIVGIAPKSFHGPYAGAEMEGYMLFDWEATSPYWPSSTHLFTSRTARRWTILARLKPAVSLKEAQGSMDVVMRRLEAQYPATDRGIGVRVIPETLARPAPIRVLANAVPLVRTFVLLLGAVVILLACMNVANLMLVRATARQREMAIRAALGSGRARLVRQMLSESLLLAFAGAAAGVVFGKWGKDAFAASIDLATDFPTLLDFHFDWRVFTYAIAAATATGVLIGLWPAICALRTDPNSALHDGRGDGGGGGRGGRRMRAALAMAQVAGSLVLLIVAGLFTRSLDRAQRMNLGFNPDQVLNVRMDPGHAGYDRAQTSDFYRELERRMQKLPGVESVSFAFSSPLGYINDALLVYVEGRASDDPQPPMAGCNSVSGPYFATLQIPLVQGRAFAESDSETAPLVAIVNETMAARFWPGQNPIGKRFHSSRADGPLRQIVGVVRDSKYFAVAEAPMPYFYTPLAQMDYTLRVLQIRSTTPPERLAPLVERQIRELDPDVPIADLQSMRRSLDGLAGFLVYRIGAMQASSMGLLGLLLAVIGVYGVISYGTLQRTHEIGVRMALGAQPSDIRRLVLRQGVLLVTVGLGAGLVGAFALSRLTTRLVMLVSATDPLTYLGVTLLLAGIALWACYIPARRAMRIDPLRALRHE
jgi:macrolide transport system ATP-binding/permease protein